MTKDRADLIYILQNLWRYSYEYWDDSHDDRMEAIHERLEGVNPK